MAWKMRPQATTGLDRHAEDRAQRCLQRQHRLGAKLVAIIAEFVGNTGDENLDGHGRPHGNRKAHGNLAPYRSTMGGSPRQNGIPASEAAASTPAAAGDPGTADAAGTGFPAFERVKKLGA